MEQRLGGDSEGNCYQGKETTVTDPDSNVTGSGVNHAKPYVISKGKKEENA